MLRGVYECTCEREEVCGGCKNDFAAVLRDRQTDWQRKKERIGPMKQGCPSSALFSWGDSWVKHLKLGPHIALNTSPFLPPLLHLPTSNPSNVQWITTFTASSGVIQCWRRRRPGGQGDEAGRRKTLMNNGCNRGAMLCLNMNGLPCSHLAWSGLILAPQRCALNVNSLFLVVGHYTDSDNLLQVSSRGRLQLVAVVVVKTSPCDWGIII